MQKHCLNVYICLNINLINVTYCLIKYFMNLIIHLCSCPAQLPVLGSDVIHRLKIRWVEGVANNERMKKIPEDCRAPTPATIAATVHFLMHYGIPVKMGEGVAIF